MTTLTIRHAASHPRMPWLAIARTLVLLAAVTALLLIVAAAAVQVSDGYGLHAPGAPDLAIRAIG